MFAGSLAVGACGGNTPKADDPNPVTADDAGAVAAPQADAMQANVGDDVDSVDVPPDPDPMPMPYGAPPARRRLV